MNAVRGLLDFLARFISETQPTHIVCAWDQDWRPSWRVAAVPSYKAHRVVAESPQGSEEDTPDDLGHQIWWIREVLGALGLPVVGAPDAEADDVIGAMVEHCPFAADIVTGDRDLFQLVDDARSTVVRYVGGGMKNTVEVTDEWLMNTYGIRGDQYADFAVLRGDPSDGLPGVAGVGDKTAARLIQQFEDLEHVVKAITAGNIPGTVAQKISDAQEYLQAAKLVVQVRRDIDGMPTWDSVKRPTRAADLSRWERLVDTLNLSGSASRITDSLWPSQSVSP